MKYFRIIFLFLLATQFISCTSVRYLTSDVKPNEITGLQRFETYANLNLIEKGNRAYYNDSISAESKAVFLKALKMYNDRIPLTGEIILTDTIIKNRIEREMEFLCLTADRQRSIINLKITPTIDSLLEKQNKRFGLITITTGFTRGRGNYGGQIAKGAAMGILTLGMYYQVPIKASSTLYAMIVDSQNNNIAFFKKSVFSDKEPLDIDVLKDQIYNIFVGYFFQRN
jgi:hypothetical protein